MKKALIALPIMASMLLVGCTGGGDSEKDKLVNAGAEVLCYANETKGKIEAFAEMDPSEVDFEELAKLQNEFMEKAEKVVKDAGFDSQEAFDEASKKYSPEELQKAVMEKAKAKCNVDDSFLSEFGDVF